MFELTKFKIIISFLQQTKLKPTSWTEVHYFYKIPLLCANHSMLFKILFHFLFRFLWTLCPYILWARTVSAIVKYKNRRNCCSVVYHIGISVSNLTFSNANDRSLALTHMGLHCLSRFPKKQTFCSWKSLLKLAIKFDGCEPIH